MPNEIEILITPEEIDELLSFEWGDLNVLQEKASLLRNHVYDSFVHPLKQLADFEVTEPTTRDAAEARRTLSLQTTTGGMRTLTSLAPTPEDTPSMSRNTSASSQIENDLKTAIKMKSSLSERRLHLTRRRLAGSQVGLNVSLADALLQVLTQANSAERNEKKPQLPFRFAAHLGSIFPFLNVTHHGEDESQVEITPATDGSHAVLLIKHTAKILRGTTLAASKDDEKNPISVRYDVYMNLKVGESSKNQGSVRVDAENVTIGPSKMLEADVFSLISCSQLNLSLFYQKLQYGLPLFQHEETLYLKQLAYWKEERVLKEKVSKKDLSLINRFICSWADRYASENKVVTLSEEIDYVAYFMVYPSLLEKDTLEHLVKLFDVSPALKLALSQQIYMVSKEDKHLKENILTNNKYRTLLGEQYQILKHRFSHSGLSPHIYPYRPRWFKVHKNICEKIFVDLASKNLIDLHMVLVRWPSQFVRDLTADRFYQFFNALTDNRDDNLLLNKMKSISQERLLEAVLRYRADLLADTTSESEQKFRQACRYSINTARSLHLQLRKADVLFGRHANEQRKKLLFRLIKVTKDRWLADRLLDKPIRWYQSLRWLLTWFRYPYLFSIRKVLIEQDKNLIQTVFSSPESQPVEEVKLKPEDYARATTYTFMLRNDSLVLKSNSREEPICSHFDFSLLTTIASIPPPPLSDLSEHSSLSSESPVSEGRRMIRSTSSYY